MKKIFDKHNDFPGNIIAPWMPVYFPFFMDGYLLVNSEWREIPKKLKS